MTPTRQLFTIAKLSKILLKIIPWTRGQVFFDILLYYIFLFIYPILYILYFYLLF
nr:MAG TPA: hypothetical protein [Caudoviricetes sp.]